MLFRVFFFVLLVSSTFCQIDFSTCARMDIAGVNKISRGLCIASCSAQNCGTGYCEKRRGRPTCVCSRCANGGNVPLDALVSKRG